MIKPTVLDCTFRDGGYYNEWIFPAAAVSAYLQALGAARIDVIEIGFRQFAQARFGGPFAYSTDEYLRRLKLPEGVTISVMINAKDLLVRSDVAESVRALFAPACQSPVSMVRIAAQPAEVPRCAPIALALKRLGYSVVLNIMQVSTLDEAALECCAATASAWDTLEVLYIADSIGNMGTSEIEKAVSAVGRAWRGPIGIHTHNNKGQAVQNALAALDAGATWLDGTIAGMGRGAGNAPTEYLLLELAQRTGSSHYPDAVFPLVIEHFEPMRVRFGWGPNLLYYLSGAYGIHPTYVQEMLGHKRYEADRIISALEKLRTLGGSSFSPSQLAEVMLGGGATASGTWSAQGWASGRRMLIVGPGPGTTEHRDAICDLIDRESPIVVCLNANLNFPVEKVTAYAACHRTRLLLDSDKYCDLQRPLITPLANIPAEIRPRLEGVSVLDYGLQVRPDTFVAGDTGCVLPAALVAPYVMALAEAAGATGVLLAGFDGYDDPNDSRRLEMEYALKCYRERPTALPITAVTPSTYDVPKASVYAPSL